MKNMSSSVGVMKFSLYGKIKFMFQTTNQYKYKCIVNYIIWMLCIIIDVGFLTFNAEFFSTLPRFQRPVGPGVWGALWQYRLSHPFATSTLLVGGWALPSEKYESQWEGWHPIHEMENNIHVPKCSKPPTTCKENGTYLKITILEWQETSRKHGFCWFPGHFSNPLKDDPLRGSDHRLIQA